MLLSLSLLAIALQGPPPGQSFNFSANYVIEDDKVTISATRMIVAVDSRRPSGTTTPKQFPPYSWSIPAGSLRLSFEPIGQPGRTPKIVGLGRALPVKMLPTMNGGSLEAATTTATIDWTGCGPGFYQMVASATIRGQDRTWSMAFGHQQFYWTPVKKIGSMWQVGQKFLIVSAQQSFTKFQPAERFKALLGSTLTLEKVNETRFRQATVVLKSDETGEAIKGEINLDMFLDSLLPVVQDDETRSLRKWIGKTVYPMGMYLSAYLSHEGNQLVRLDRGHGAIKIRSIWRAAKQQGLGQIDPEMIGDQSQLLTGWYPILAVFDVKTPRSMFMDHPNVDISSHMIAALPDGWAFDREFSTTPKMTSFPSWKPQPNLKEPVFPEVGMSPFQLAWLRSWPTFIGSMKDTLALSEWRFHAYQQPEDVFRFSKGKLVSGRGVISAGGR